jgi:hypothetical protein
MHLGTVLSICVAGSSRGRSWNCFYILEVFLPVVETDGRLKLENTVGQEYSM